MRYKGTNDLNYYYSRKGSTQYPLPSLNSPYVYLQSLMNSHGASIRVGQHALSLLDASHFHITNESIENGLEFLKQAASAQRNHERSFIKAKIDKLKSLGNLGREEKQIIMQLEAMSYDFNNTSFDYFTFIKGLNMVITNIEKYKSRIEGFNKKSVVNTPQLNLVQGLDTTLGSITGKRHAFYLSQEELIRQLAIQFFNRDKGQAFITSQIATNGIENIAAALAIITQQLARYIYDAGKMQYKSKSYFKTMQEFKQKFEELAKQFDDFANHSNIESLYTNQQLLDEIKELYGIKISKEKITNKGISNIARQKLQNLQKELENDNIFDKNVKDLLKRIKVNFKYKQNALSYQKELVSALAAGFDSHSAIGSKNMATDMLLGWFQITIDDIEPTNNYENKVANTLKQITNKLSNSGNNNLDKTSNIYIEELTRLQNSLSELEHGFVLHETTKNYNTLERGHWPQSMNSFSGREMNIFNYINGIDLLGNISGINVSQLEFIALNLATDAIGYNLKQPLESLLAIFGGIMMFDDFAIIGKEITQNMTFSNMDCIHLYRLQDIYYPASMFLDATWQNMTIIKNELLKGNGFTVKISVPTINYYVAPNIPNTSYGPTFKSRWEGVREYAEKNTTIHLHFASNFLSLMASLF